MVKVPPGISQAGWIVNPLAVEEAMAELQIRLPLRVRLTTGWRLAGKYRVRPEGHVILLSGRHPIERANSTLWHELAHAQQLERYASVPEFEPKANIAVMMFTARKLYESGGLDYATNAGEVAARKIAEHYGSRWLLLLEP